MGKMSVGIRETQLNSCEDVLKCSTLKCDLTTEEWDSVAKKLRLYSIEENTASSQHLPLRWMRMKDAKSASNSFPGAEQLGDELGKRNYDFTFFTPEQLKKFGISKVEADSV